MNVIDVGKLDIIPETVQNLLVDHHHKISKLHSTVFKLPTDEEIGHSSVNSNKQRSQPHTKFKPSKTTRDISFQ